MFEEVLGLKEEITVKIPPYEEPEDEALFRRLIATSGEALGPSLKTTEGVAIEMSKAYMDLDWSD